MVGRPVLALLLVAAVAGCGDDADDPPGTGTTPGSGSQTTLEVERSDAPVRTITCPGGDECARLARTSVSEFAPVPPDAVCTQQYGGDATAAVRGRLRGRRVQARFALTDGCEIARWERLSWLLGEPPTDD